MIKFKEADTYILHSVASGPRETRGPYVAELLYEINVNLRPNVRDFVPPVAITGVRSDRHSGVIGQILSDKVKNSELTKERANTILEYAGLPGRIEKEEDDKSMSGNKTTRTGKASRIKNRSRR